MAQSWEFPGHFAAEFEGTRSHPMEWLLLSLLSATGVTGGAAAGWGATMVPEVASDVDSGIILSNSPGLCGFLRGSLFASHGDVPVTLI